MSLTIEFAGITTLVWDKAKGEAEVLLVDLAAAGFDRHHAMLAMADSPAVVAPQPDASIAVPGQPLELGLWNLAGTEITIEAKDGGPLEVVADAVNADDPPGPGAESIRWLANISELCQSNTLNAKCPIAARLRIKSGRITATAANYPQVRAQFSLDDRPLGPMHYVLSRFMLEVLGEDVTLRLDSRRTIEVHTDHHAMVSNTCVFERNFGLNAGHFYAHYLIVKAQRRPTVRRMPMLQRVAFAAFSVPDDPEHCMPAFVEL